MQEHDHHMRPVAYASRSLSKTEMRYSQIEKECLAATWASERFSSYITGLKSYNLCTDHKPLVQILNTKELNELTPRLQRPVWSLTLP